MEDEFSGFVASLADPATRLETVVPDDTADLARATRALSCGSDGQVVVTTLGGDTGTITLNAGSVFPIRVVRVWATGTTAGDIVGLS